MYAGTYRPQPEVPRRKDKRRRLRNTLWAQYRMTLEEFDARMESQGGGCAICKAPPAKTKRADRLSVDHDHRCCPGVKTCGKCVRGLLCTRCNNALAVLENRSRSTLYALEMYARYGAEWRATQERKTEEYEDAVEVYLNDHCETHGSRCREFYDPFIPGAAEDSIQ
jgi:hypothetical protein